MNLRISALGILKRILVSLGWWIALWFATAGIVGAAQGAVYAIIERKMAPPETSKHWGEVSAAAGATVGFLGFVVGLCGRLPGTRRAKTSRPD